MRLGEVSRRVGLRSGEARLSRRVERCCTVAAELVLRRALAPHDGQTEASGAAHWPQNFIPVGFSAWHREHFMPEPPSSGAGDGPKGALRLRARGFGGQGHHRDLTRVCESPPSLTSWGPRSGSTMGDLPRLPYTQHLVSETMRLYPPAYGMGRQAVRRSEVAGHPIAKGMIVIIPTWVVHRDPRWFEEAETFRPERWLTT